MAEKYYDLYRDGKMLGRGTASEFKEAAASGKIRPDDVVRNAGAASGVAAATIESLRFPESAAEIDARLGLNTPAEEGGYPRQDRLLGFQPKYSDKEAWEREQKSKKKEKERVKKRAESVFQFKYGFLIPSAFIDSNDARLWKVFWYLVCVIEWVVVGLLWAVGGLVVLLLALAVSEAKEDSKQSNGQSGGGPHGMSYEERVRYYVQMGQSLKQAQDNAVRSGGAPHGMSYEGLVRYYVQMGQTLEQAQDNAARGANH